MNEFEIWIWLIVNVRLFRVKKKLQLPPSPLLGKIFIYFRLVSILFGQVLIRLFKIIWEGSLNILPIFAMKLCVPFSNFRGNFCKSFDRATRCQRKLIAEQHRQCSDGNLSMPRILARNAITFFQSPKLKALKINYTLSKFDVCKWICTYLYLPTCTYL